MTKNNITEINELTRSNPLIIAVNKDRNVTFDIPGGSVVRIFHDTEGTFEGVVFVNPIHEESRGKLIKLMHAYKVNGSGKQLMYPVTSMLEFPNEQILQVYVLKLAHQSIKPSGEIVMQTFVVTTVGQFKNLMRALDSGVSEVALKIYGETVGRFMKVYWIVLCVRNTIIPIDMQAEVFQRFRVKAWTELKLQIFENSKLVKIVHDLRHEADYLYHNDIIGIITLKNVFDTQMGVYFMDIRKWNLDKKNGTFEKLPLQEDYIIVARLSVCLKRYLGDVVWDREITILNHYELKNFATDNLFTLRPLPSVETLKYMALSVKYLAMLRDALTKSMIKTYDMCNEMIVSTLQRASLEESVKYLQTPNVYPEAVAKKVEELAIMLNAHSEVSPAFKNLVESRAEMS